MGFHSINEIEKFSFERLYKMDLAIIMLGLYEILYMESIPYKVSVDEALNLASLNPQFGEIWIVFDRDQVKDFDEIIRQAHDRRINVGWTNPCIEAWFSAYFGEMPNYQDSVSCCSGFSTTYERATRQRYVKSDPQIYEKLNRFGNEQEAVALAERKFIEHRACPCS